MQRVLLLLKAELVAPRVQPNAAITIVRTAAAPLIDGNSEPLWAQATAQPIDQRLFGATVTASDLSASYRALYDATSLYLLVEVNDDVQMADSGEEWYQDDTVELYIDGDQSRGESYDGVNDFQLGFHWQDSTVQQGTHSVAPPSGIHFQLVATTVGYRLEAALPLTQLGVASTPATNFGLELHVIDDDDGGEREAILGWSALVDDAWQRPASFGAATLGAEATAARRWQASGFGGAGAFVTLHFDTQQPGVIYATSDVAGVFRSSDQGEHWEMRSLGLGNYEVSSFAIDPFDSHTLYAGVGAFANSHHAGLYISHDEGLTWQPLGNSRVQQIDFRVQRTINAIAPNPQHQGVIVSGSRSKGIWRSTDGGTTWVQVMPTPTTDLPPFNSGAGAGVVDKEGENYPAPVMVVRFDPTQADLVYAALYGIGVFKSNEGGAQGTWQAVNNGLPAKPALHDLIVAVDGALYLAAGPEGIFKSNNQGASWQTINGSGNGAIPLQDFRVLSLAADPTNSSRLYFTQERVDNPSRLHPAVWRSNDGGANWAPISANVATDPIHSPPDLWWFDPISSWRVTVDPLQPNRLFFLLGGIYRSEDGGAQWRNQIVGAQDTCVTDLLVDFDPTGGPDQIYATHLDAGLLLSSDEGESWQMVMPSSVAQRTDFAGHYWRMAIVRNGSEKHFFVTVAPWLHPHHQVLHSTDGVNWQALFTASVPDGDRGLGQLNLAVDPSHPGIVYIAPDGGAVQKSSDFGQSWAPTAAQPNATRFEDLAVDSGGRLFAATFFEGLWRSQDGGASWQQVLTERSLVRHLTTADNTIYAAAEDGNLYRSSDGGDSWQALTDFPFNNDSDGGSTEAVAVAVDPTDGNHLALSRYDSWHSADQGDGVYESVDGGASWQPINEGLRYPRVNALAFGRNGTLFAGTTCGGLWRLSQTESQPLNAQSYLPFVIR